MSIPAEVAAVLRPFAGIFPLPVLDIAARQGIEIYETPDFSDRQSGLIRKEGDRYVIYVNERHPATRKRFTIAHELAHYFLHREKLDSGTEYVEEISQPFTSSVSKPLYRSDKEMTDEERTVENEANDLAADILMPEQAFREMFALATTIEEVAKKFGVSSAAATIRGKNLLGDVLA